MRGFRMVVVGFWTRGKRLLESAQVMYQPRVQEASIINTICTWIKILQTLSWSIVEAKPDWALMLRSRMQGGPPRSAARVPRNPLAIGFFCVVESQHSSKCRRQSPLVCSSALAESIFSFQVVSSSCSCDNEPVNHQFRELFTIAPDRRATPKVLFLAGSEFQRSQEVTVDAIKPSTNGD